MSATVRRLSMELCPEVHSRRLVAGLVVLHWTAAALLVGHTARMYVLRMIPIAVLLAAPACAVRSHSTVVEGSPAAQVAELWAEAVPVRRYVVRDLGEHTARDVLRLRQKVTDGLDVAGGP